jgi:hypothetical protein
MKRPAVPDRASAPALLARARARAEQRGAALFLVVLVLTIVAGIGVFSMRSAGLVELATGYSRQSVQTTFVAEYAARASATYLESNPGLVSSNERVVGCAPRLQAIDEAAPCMVFKTSLLEESLEATAPRGFDDGVNGQLFLPHDLTGVNAEFVTEMTEPTMANVIHSPGFTAGLFKQVTFTSIARVFPTADTDIATTDTMCSPAARGSVSQQTVRAHVIVPM